MENFFFQKKSCVFEILFFPALPGQSQGCRKKVFAFFLLKKAKKKYASVFFFAMQKKMWSKKKR
jgi:hypothetical protein